MRVLFAGNPSIAVPALERVFSLPKHICELAGVLTNCDAPSGKGCRLEATDVGRTAAQWGTPVLKVEKLDASAREAVSALHPDLLVSFAYGRLFGPKFLSLFPCGGVNVHPSLLPKYRGPSPIQTAILNRDAETGISIQRLAREMDSGDILLQEKIPLSGRENTGGLSEIAARKAADLLERALAGISDRSITDTPQNTADATFCHVFTKEDARIDWTMSARVIDAQVRAFNPWPMAWTRYNGARLFILEARFLDAEAPGAPGLVLRADKQDGILVNTGKGLLAVTRLQLETKKALDWRSFLNGARGFLEVQFETN
ncbi:MAG: methionyl-tRNA formyltransferase [Treponema sp.]|jgi:methionyl-tRNA formyltransferase|nr:methionyl-tRNA formyltransferase [Treponema sp.]